MLKKTFQTFYLGLLFSFGFFGGIILLVKAAGLTATTGEPLTVSKWTDMAANFFWGSGSGGIYYNGKVGIGTNAPNKNLHIYDTTNNAEINLQSVSGSNKHWAIYQDKNDSHFYIWNTQNNLGISTGGNVDANGRVNGKGGICMNGDCKTAWNQVSGGGTVNYTGTCDSAHKGYSGLFGSYYKICNGLNWYNLGNIQTTLAGAGTDADPYRFYGETISSTNMISNSCHYYNMIAGTLNDGNTIRGSGTCGGGTKTCLTSGVYRITLSGITTNVYCDMVSDGGGWTLIVGINASDQTHNSSSAVTPGNLVGVSGKGKYSDAFINSIRTASGSEGIVKLICGANSDYFDYRITTWHATFIANPNGVGWDTYTQPWGTAPNTTGGSSYPNQPGPWSYSTTWGNSLIYGYNGWTGCYNGAASGQSGTTWIR